MGVQFFTPKGSDRMAATLILLYALNASSPIPVGCFIAAWAVFGIETTVRTVRMIHKRKNKR